MRLELVIKIRYACLPEGQHARAIARRRHETTIYLRPDLGPQQRREALSRLRRNARLGHAPPLPAAGVARAMAADRIAVTLRGLLAVLHYHPLGAIGLAGLLAGAAVSYTTLVPCPPPAGRHMPSASLPAENGGGYPGRQITGSALPGIVLLPLGSGPLPWRVPEVRPRHHGRPGAGPCWRRRPCAHRWPHPPHRHWIRHGGWQDGGGPHGYPVWPGHGGRPRHKRWQDHGGWPSSTVWRRAPGTW